MLLEESRHIVSRSDKDIVVDATTNMTSSTPNNISASLDYLKCSLCGREFRGEYKNTLLTRHFRTHTGERPHPCPYCPYRAGSSYNLGRHVKTKHSSLLQY